MLPKVIIHNAVSVDGRLDHFRGDIALYYELAGRFQADAMLSGSGTILAAYRDNGRKPPARDAEKTSGQWLVIVDTRGQVKNLERIRSEPFWKDVIVLVSEITPEDHIAFLKSLGVPYIRAGKKFVDLRRALEELRKKYRIETIRTDSGGPLNGALLREGLADELSLLVCPYLVGGQTNSGIFIAPDLEKGGKTVPVTLFHTETLPDGSVWLRYRIGK